MAGSTEVSTTTTSQPATADISRWRRARARIEHGLRPWRRANPGARYLVIAGAAITLLFAFLAVFADTVAPFGEDQYCADEFFNPENGACIGVGPDEQVPNRAPPSTEYPFGTTDTRFDVLSRVILGARLAFAVVAFSTAFAMLIGVPLGLFSGYIGGRFDRVMVLVMDAIYAFPSLLLAIMIAFALGLRLEQLGIDAPFVPAAVSVGTVYIPQYFRVIRNHTLSVKEEPYVEAAKSLGASRTSIVFRYVFFNVVSSIPVLFTLNAADAVLTMAGLGFLGYGVRFPTAEWGLDVSLALADSVAGFWWTAFWPGVAITLLVTGLSLMGEGLNDIINPLLRVKGYRGKAKASARETMKLAGDREPAGATSRAEAGA
ncbi:ABC transporter permease [Euzebya tangerina]|uniref:ABC transporter permease n=1 Tax=Euzebya tangerina TaxID=591198 RepID=UPI000E31FE6D|nr:ABC transporter permease [Euzebya tangerina]